MGRLHKEASTRPSISPGFQNLPLIHVIENNQWGMGTAVKRAISLEPIAEKKALGLWNQWLYVQWDGLLQLLRRIQASSTEQMMRDSRPVLVEVVTERFPRHSILILLFIG